MQILPVGSSFFFLLFFLTGSPLRLCLSLVGALAGAIDREVAGAVDGEVAGAVNGAMAGAVDGAVGSVGV